MPNLRIPQSAGVNIFWPMLQLHWLASSLLWKHGFLNLWRKWYTQCVSLTTCPSYDYMSHEARNVADSLYHDFKAKKHYTWGHNVETQTKVRLRWSQRNVILSLPHGRAIKTSAKVFSGERWHRYIEKLLHSCPRTAVMYWTKGSWLMYL